MKKSDDLFQLIKSMSMSEKRYFKLHAGVHTIGEKNVYVKLFDVIDRMKEYDEEVIKKKFKDEKFTNNLFSAKNYLFNLILKILNIYYLESSVDSKLKTMMGEMDILFNKGLYKPYSALLIKAEKIAKENEKYFILAQLIERKTIFAVSQYFGEKVQIDIDALREDMIGVLDKIRYTYEYRVLYDKLFFLVKQTDYAISRGEDESLEKYISDPLFKDDSKAVTLTARFFRNTILSHYYFRKNDFEKCYELRKELVLLMEADPRSLILYPRNYMSIVANLTVVCERLKKYDEVYRNIEKLKNRLKTTFKNEKAYKDVWSKMTIPMGDTELSYYIHTCRFDKLDKITKRIIEDVDKYTDKFNESRKITVYNVAAYAYFINKKYEQSLEYINKTLNYQNTAPEEKAYSIARIFVLILHFEMGNYELLEYILNTTKKYLAKKNRLYNIEELIIGFIEDSLNFNEDSEMTERMRRFKYDLDKLTSGTQNNMPLDFFDITSWIESKIEKKDFREVLKEKCGK